MWTREYLKITHKRIILIGLAVIGLSLILRYFNFAINNSIIAHLEAYGIYEGIFVFLFGLFLPTVMMYQDKVECQKCGKKGNGSILLRIYYKRYGYKEFVLKSKELRMDGWRYDYPYASLKADKTSELCPECNLKQTKNDQDKLNKWIATPEMVELLEKGPSGEPDNSIYQWLIKNQGKAVDIKTKTIDRFDHHMDYPEIKESDTEKTQIPPPSIETGRLELRWFIRSIVLPSQTFSEVIITDDEMVYKRYWNWAMHGDEIIGVLEPTSGKGHYEEILTIRLCSLRNKG